MNSEQMNETTSYGGALISRLLMLYLEGASLPGDDKPLTIPQIRRLMRSIVGEGYGPGEPTLES